MKFVVKTAYKDKKTGKYVNIGDHIDIAKTRADEIKKAGIELEEVKTENNPKSNKED